MNKIKIDNINSVLTTPKGTSAFVLNDISIEIPKGKVIGIIGESGSGKTQLALAICGLQPMIPGVVSGNSSFDSDSFMYTDKNESKIEKILLPFSKIDPVKKITDRGYKLRMDTIGFIPQDPKSYLNPYWSLNRLFRETFNLRDDVTNFDSFIEGYLEDVGLDAKTIRYQYPSELSGGEAQRAMIAFILSKKPKFIIADESTTGLDVSRQKTVINLLKNIVERNDDITLILISHDFGFLDHLVEFYCVVYGGFLCEFIENKKNIFTNEELHPYTKDLVSRLVPSKTDIETHNELASSVDVFKKLDSCPYIGNCSFYNSHENTGHECEKGLPKSNRINTSEEEHWIACVKYEE